MYSIEPHDGQQFTKEFDKVYSRFAGIYDMIIRLLPVWRRWISHAIPEISGPRVLEVSFGTGYLLTKYADNYSVFGIDYNAKLAQTAKQNLRKSGAHAHIQQADVSALPYPSETFDCIVNTMAFTAYPDGQQAMQEICRVLKTNGRLVLIDINYPADRNRIGMALVRMWSQFGDLIRDMQPLFASSGFQFSDREVGGFGSVHLYLGTKT